MLSKQFCSAGKGLGPKSKIFKSFAPLPTLLVLFFLCPLPFPPSLSSLAHASRAPAMYLGSDACQECHPEEYDSFITYAKKSRSFESIEQLRHGLLPEEIERCYSCHTTGYGKPGGFVDLEHSSHLKNAGCEVCHGPGSVHALSRSPVDIKRHLTPEDCGQCHVSERVKSFRYKPMIHGGAH